MVVGGVKGQDAIGGVEDGDGVDVHLDVAGGGLRGVRDGRKRREGLTGRRSFGGRAATRPWMRTADSTGTSARRARMWGLRTTSWAVPEGSLRGKKESAPETFLRGVSTACGGGWGRTSLGGVRRRGRRVRRRGGVRGRRRGGCGRGRVRGQHGGGTWGWVGGLRHRQFI